MATNDGQKLLVFGLGFAQHDSRKMQQVLRHYDRMPSTPGSRAALFVELTKLGKDLAADERHQAEAQKLEDWIRHGGNFPLGITPAPINATPTRDHSISHMPMEGQGVGWPLQRTSSNHNRYGAGHTLNDPEDGEDNSQHAGDDERLGNPLNEVPHGWAAPEDVREPERGNLQQWNSESDEDQDMDQLSDDEDQGWDNNVPSRAAFHGPGRTLNDAEEHPIADDQDQTATPAIAPPDNRNNNLGIPQLRGDQQWRGNNVHGIQPHGGALGMGMGVGIIPNRVPRARQRRRMEHDLEEEDDDDMDGLDGWDVGHGQFVLGPGRTLNDPAPEQAEDHFAVDESHHSDSEIEDTAASSKPEDDDAEPIECPICLEEYPPSGFPQRATITELCDHPDKSCLQCLDSSIATIIQTGALHILACPICPQKLSSRDVKEYANKKVYERYKYLKQQALRPGYFISCTNSSCGGSQAHDCDGPNGPKMVCNFCQAETCAKHRRPWHEGQTCLQFDMNPAQIERLEEEEATAKLLAQEATSICPKCGQGVTKTEGCDHMMCQCGTEWCYVCSCSWENILRIGATAHANFCIYYPNKVNLTKTQQEAAGARIMGLVHGGEVSAELSRARDEFRQRRREEMRPKLAEAADARRNQMMEQKRQQSLSSTGQMPPRKKNKVKLLPPWEEGGRSKRAL